MKWSVNIFRKKKIYKDYTLLVTKKDQFSNFQMSYSYILVIIIDEVNKPFMIWQIVLFYYNYLCIITFAYKKHTHNSVLPDFWVQEVDNWSMKPLSPTWFLGSGSRLLKYEASAQEIPRNPSPNKLHTEPRSNFIWREFNIKWTVNFNKTSIIKSV